MKKITVETDVITMALMYRYRYVGTDRIPLKKIIEFDKIINEKLENNNSQSEEGFRYIKHSFFYEIVEDENHVKYAILNKEMDMQQVWDYCVTSLPLDILVETQSDEALKAIDLKLEDGVLKQREEEVKLTRKRKE